MVVSVSVSDSSGTDAHFRRGYSLRDRFFGADAHFRHRYSVRDWFLCTCDLTKWLPVAKQQQKLPKRQNLLHCKKVSRFNE